ncbi:MAG: multi-sensor hybrid histidine kinase [Ignavibacteria bacterium]|nr:MAG: multi-sensor hybrid histidine kinase [Ignavibacteria bacterium]KAF0161397.1 MAG: multi-sensor hybrid histidine kinase [Ignavibacteria bacterium]
MIIETESCQLFEKILVGAKFELIQKLNELVNLSQKGDVFFPDELCNFLCIEFDLSALVLFDLKDGKVLEVIGKSASAKKNFKSGSTHYCNSCTAIHSNEFNKLFFDSKCTIQVSDFMTYEGCGFFSLTTAEKVLVKIGKKSAFTKNEQEQFERSLHIVSLLISTWKVSKSTSYKPSVGFSHVVEETARELKANANSIVGFLSYLLNENPTSSQQEYISSIKKNAQSISLNINDLNELAKIDKNNLTKYLKQVDLNVLLNEIVENFRSRLGTRKINFNVLLDKPLLRPVELDEQKLKYIISMLLFVSTTLTLQGEISVQVSVSKDSKLRFEISDTGNQLDANTLSEFFEPFVVANKSEFKATNITGLSFTLVKSFVNYLGGEISAGKNEKGNSFIFTISGEVMPDFESTLSQLPKPSTKNKVLVIEDDYATSKLLSNYLNKWGYDPTIVSTESQAFSVIEKETLLAVILDIELPTANGLEMLKKMHDHPKTKNIPVIVCSVEPEQQKAFLMGAVEYFIKPINYNYLVEVLTSYKLRKNSNVLCVDDDLPTLNLVKQAIEQAGFNAVAINISAAVMEVIKDKDIDLAIVDLDMPTPNGFELIKLIKSEKRFARLPIIIYTGKENYQEDLKQIEGLFEDLLDKRSTNIEDLAETINAMINRYETPPPAAEVIKSEGGLKILLAEDYKHSQIIVTRLLKKNGFESIVVVENGEDAFKMARDQKFDLILMDMQMPIMNGFEATEKIREIASYKETPIIALTAFAMKGDREKCIESGATDYIPKPIDSKEFIDKVKYYTNTLS